MEIDPSNSRSGRLRGLDAERVLGVLEDDVRQSPPQIPGWRISGVAGEGGSGIVWRAVRLIDGMPAAIKTASPDDPETVERIEREAGFLRELRHPHIVGLLEAGPLTQGLDEGGLYLAMEFIDGPALVHQIPEHGLPLELAFRWFREIAAAVAHAHDAGILHRDLKPSNVLVTPDGHLKVADFGLARPIHRRVHMLSLTRAGLVAGTAEYLPPEAYRRDYRPHPSADIFALGVMLHEMLTGSPPRGAWQPASSQKKVDVRIDAIIHRAMDPDPDRRWPDVRAMVTELDAILASPPRYAGTPLVTFPIRVMDGLWTLLGLFVFLAGTSTMMRLTKSWLTLPFDLLGNQGRLIGSFHALFLLSLAAIPLGVWQLARLIRFRHVPLREALPSPFGLRLGYSRTAAALVFLCQIFCLVIPVLHLNGLYMGASLSWLQADDSPWTHGLVVTRFENLDPVSPWAFPKLGVDYRLSEYQGPPAHPLATCFGRLSFIPFYTPVLMLTGGVLSPGALLVAALFACRTWWCRNRRVGSVLVASATLGLVIVVAKSRDREVQVAGSRRLPVFDKHAVTMHMTAHLVKLADELLGAETGDSVFGDDGVRLALYADQVDYRGSGLIPRTEIPRLFDAGLTRAEKITLTVRKRNFSWNPLDGSFKGDVEALQTFDGLAADGRCGADELKLTLSGTVDLDGATRILGETLVRQPIYLAERRTADRDDAIAWAESFGDAFAIAARDPKACEVALGNLFHPLTHAFGDNVPGLWFRSGSGRVGSLIHLLETGSLSLDPSGTAIENALPGGCTRISVPLKGGGSGTLHADLVCISGKWLCVGLVF